MLVCEFVCRCVLVCVAILERESAGRPQECLPRRVGVQDTGRVGCGSVFVRLVCSCVCVRVCWCVLEKERVAGRSPCRTEAGNVREAV